MKKKVATILTITTLVFAPSTARADIEVSGFMELINVAMEKVDTIVKQYSNIQANLQELSLNRNIVSQLKDKVTSEIKNQAMKAYNEIKDYAMAQGMMFVKTSLSSISLPGVGQYIDMGAFVNPKLKVAVGQKYIKRKHKKDDVKYIADMDKKSNDLAVENLSTMFANALVRRVQLIELDPCRCVDASDNLASNVPNCDQKQADICKEKRDELKEMSDVSVIKERYFNTLEAASSHWWKMQEAWAIYSKLISETQMNQGTVDDIEDVTGVIDESLEDKEKEMSDEIKEKLQKQREANTLDVSKLAIGTLSDIKSGNITKAIANVTGGAANVYGNAPGHWDNVADVIQGAATGAKTFDNFYGNAKNGNWGGALSATVGGAGSIISGAGAGDVGAVFSNAAGGSGSTLNAALNGNWGDAIRNTTGVAGNIVRGQGNGTLGSTIGAAGSLTDVGIDAVNAGGNWGNYINNTIGSGQAQNALGNMQGAFGNDAAEDAAELAKLIKQEEDAKKAAEEDAARKEAAKEEAKADCISCREAQRETPWCLIRCNMAGM